MLPLLLMLLGAYFVLGLSGSTIMVAIAVMCMTYAFQLYMTQENILYQPRSSDAMIKNPTQYYNTPHEYGLQYQKVRIKTLDGKELEGFYVPAHRYNTETRAYEPIMTKKIAQTINAQATKLSQIDTVDYNIDSDLGEDSSSSDEEREEEEEVIEFSTSASLRAVNWQEPRRNKATNKNNKSLAQTRNLAKKKAKEAGINTFFDQLHSQSAHLYTTSTFDLASLVTDDKRHIDENIATFLWFHGNAGSIHLRLPQLFHTVTTQLANVLIIDYRSYGESTRVEVVTEEGLVVDAVSSFVYLQERVDIDPNFTFIFGQSLGSAVSIALAESIEIALTRREKYKREAEVKDNKAAKNGDDESDDDDSQSTRNNTTKKPKIEHVTFDSKNLGQPGLDITDIVSPRLISITPPCGIVLENTFTSIGDLVDILFPFIAPIKNFLLRLKWFSAKRLERVKTIPVLFISSLQDEIIPSQMMKVLHDTVPHSNKAIVFIPDGHHNDAWITGGSNYYIKLQQFIQLAAAKQHVASISTRVDNVGHIIPVPVGSDRDSIPTFTSILIKPTVEHLKYSIDDVNKVIRELTIAQFGSAEALQAYLREGTSE